MNPPSSTAFVSVVIPAHNRAHFVLEAVRSALSQGPAVGEVVVVDDGSTDATPEVLRTISDPRLSVLRQAQSGPVAARNHGWLASHGDWVLFLDSDDALPSGAVELLLAAARKHPERIAFGEASVHAQQLDQPPHYTFCFAHRDGNLLNELCFYAGGTILSCLFPRSVLRETGGFGGLPESDDCEDFDFGLRLALRYEFTFVPFVCYQIRMHDTNRHRPLHRQVWASSLVCVERRLPSNSRYWLLKRRVKAYYRGLMAGYDLTQHQSASAIRGFILSLLWWPIKLGAWRGLFQACTQCVLRAPPPARN